MFASIIGVSNAELVRAILNATIPNEENMQLLTKEVMEDDNYIVITHIASDFGTGRVQYLDSYSHKSQDEPFMITVGKMPLWSMPCRILLDGEEVDALAEYDEDYNRYDVTIQRKKSASP